MPYKIFSFLLILYLSSCISFSYTFMRGDSQCFEYTLTEDTLVTGSIFFQEPGMLKLNIAYIKSTGTTTSSIIVRDITSKKFQPFSFTSMHSGTYKICLENPGVDTIEAEITIDVGVEAKDFDKSILEKGNLLPIEQSVLNNLGFKIN